MTLAVDVQLYAEPYTPPPPARITGWRFLHRAEGSPRTNPDNMPEIRNSAGDIVTWMTKDVQELAWGVMKALNPVLQDNKFPALHTDHTAMNNGEKFGYNPNQPHSDWINLENLTAPDPGYDKTRGYGGQLIQAYDEGANLRVVPGVHCIDPNNLPTVQEVIDRKWYSKAVNVYANGTVGDFAQGKGGIIAYLWISSRDAVFPKSWFQWWDETYYPDHLTMYVTP